MSFPVPRSSLHDIPVPCLSLTVPFPVQNPPLHVIPCSTPFSPCHSCSSFLPPWHSLFHAVLSLSFPVPRSSLYSSPFLYTAPRESYSLFWALQINFKLIYRPPSVLGLSHVFQEIITQVPFLYKYVYWYFHFSIYRSHNTCLNPLIARGGGGGGREWESSFSLVCDYPYVLILVRVLKSAP